MRRLIVGTAALAELAQSDLPATGIRATTSTLLRRGRSGNAALVLDTDPWESAVLGRAAFRLRVLGDARALGHRDVATLLAGGGARSRGAYVLARSAAADPAASRLLQEAGFDFLETLLEYAAPPADLVHGRSDGDELRLRPAGGDDVGACTAMIAGLARGRYWLDPLLGEPFEWRAYRSWLEGAVGGRERFVVAEVVGVASGFVTWSVDAEGDARIGLFGVAQGLPRKGVGETLIGHVADRCRAESVERILVGTSASNIRAQRFYLRSGFKPHGAYFTFRRCRP